MSDAKSDAADPVRFVPVDTGPTYPRQRLLAEVPVGHMVNCVNFAPCVVTYKGADLITLLVPDGQFVMWKESQVVMDYGPVEDVFAHAAGGWQFTLAQPPAPATVRLANLNWLDVFSYGNGKTIAVVFARHGNGKTIIGVDGMVDTMPDDLSVTLLGSLKFGGVA